MFTRELFNLLVAKQELYRTKMMFEYDITLVLGVIQFVAGTDIIMSLDYRPSQKMIEVFNCFGNLHHKVLVDKGSDYMIRDIHNSLRLCLDEYLGSQGGE